MPAVAHGVDGDPGEQQGEHVHLAERRRHPIDEHRRPEGAEEGEDGHGERTQRRRERERGLLAEHEHQRRAERSAGGRARQPGLDDRIAKQPLHQGARDAKHGAGEPGEQHAREAQLEEHVAGEGIGGPLGHPAGRFGHVPPHLAGRERERADFRRGDDGDEEEQREEQVELAEREALQHREPVTARPSPGGRSPPAAAPRRASGARSTSRPSRRCGRCGPPSPPV